MLIQIGHLHLSKNDTRSVKQKATLYITKKKDRDICQVGPLEATVSWLQSYH